MCVDQMKDDSIADRLSSFEAATQKLKLEADFYDEMRESRVTKALTAKTTTTFLWVKSRPATRIRRPIRRSFVH